MADFVPQLPPEHIIDPLTLFKTYFYQHVSDFMLITFRKGSAAANHSLDNYIEALS